MKKKTLLILTQRLIKNSGIGSDSKKLYEIFDELDCLTVKSKKINLFPFVKKLLYCIKNYIIKEIKYTKYRFIILCCNSIYYIDYVLNFINTRKANYLFHNHSMLLDNDILVINNTNTMYIVRHHDLIPLTHLHFFIPLINNTNPTNHPVHKATKKKIAYMLSKSNVVFMSNSLPVQNQLIELYKEEQKNILTQDIIDKEIERRFFVIPCIVEKNLQITNINKKISDIIPSFNNDTKYIIICCTIEPRKNHIKVIKAWNKFRIENNIDLKFVIVGKYGWQYDDIKLMIEEYSLTGNLIHLSNIDNNEDRDFLMKNAQCLIFPSFIEGFGIPPVEAGLQNCPAIVSDIEVHRWVMGDSALFCDPYDVDDIKNKIYQLCCDKNAKELKEKLLNEFHTNIANRYSKETVKKQLNEMFYKINADNTSKN